MPRARLRLAVKRLNRIVLTVVLLCSCFRGVAQADDTGAYAIACRLELERDPALTPRLAEAVRLQVQGVFRAVLGDQLKFHFLSAESADQLPGGAPRSLNPDALVERWPGPERLLLVYLYTQGSSVVAQAREFDPQFQILGPLSEGRTTQRELVPDSAARAALQAFSPVAKVRSARGTAVQIEFLAGRRLEAYRSWLGLSGEVGLQVMREPLVAGPNGPSDGNADSPRSTRYRRTFLTMRHWGPDRAECELIGPDANLFRDLGSPSVRYLARPARGEPGATAIQVVRRDSKQPQEGCEVFVSAVQYSTEPPASRGVTDRAGTVRFEPDSSGIQFVSVRYEDLVLKAPLLSGASGTPLVFELPTRGRRADFVRPLRLLYRDLSDQILIDNRVIEELKTKADAKDATEVRRLVTAEGKRKRLTQQEVLDRVQEVEQRARSEGEDVTGLAADVRELASKGATRPLDQVLAAYTKWADRLDKEATLRSLVDQMKEVQNRMDWAALLPLYERLAEVDPDNQEWANQLRRLGTALTVKGPEHEQARAFVDDQWKDITVRNLANRWPDIEGAAEILLAAKDYLTLLKVRRSLTNWLRELVPETKGLTDQLKAAADDEDRLAELQERLRRLNDQNGGMQKLHKKVQEFLSKLEL